MLASEELDENFDNIESLIENLEDWIDKVDINVSVAEKIKTGNDWYYDENIEGVKETDDKEIKSILDTLYEEFPYINTQYVG